MVICLTITVVAQTSVEKYFLVKPKTAQSDNRVKLRTVFGADLISANPNTGEYLVKSTSLNEAKEKVKTILPDATVREVETSSGNR